MGASIENAGIVGEGAGFVNLLNDRRGGTGREGRLGGSMLISSAETEYFSGEDVERCVRVLLDDLDVPPERRLWALLPPLPFVPKDEELAFGDENLYSS